MRNPAFIIDTADAVPYVVHDRNCTCTTPDSDGDHHYRVAALTELEDPWQQLWWFRPRDEAW